METIDLRQELKKVDFRYEDLPEPIPQLLEFTEGKILSPYRSENTKALWSLGDLNYKPLAWTPNIRYLLYNLEDNIILEDIEGDIYIILNPTKEKINELCQQYPKGEVSLGEKYDNRFNNVEV